MAPINSKTLSAKLKELQGYGIVAKKIIDPCPSGVEDSLTKKGSEPSKMIAGMSERSEKWYRS